MTRQNAIRENSSARTTLTQTACVCCGIACLAWGLAPAIIERLITGNAPQVRTLAIGSAAGFVGATFMAIALVLRRGRRWGLWAAFGLSLALVAISIPAIHFSGNGGSASFLPMFGTCVVVTSWLSLRPGATAGGARRGSAAHEDWRTHAGVSHLVPSPQGRASAEPTHTPAATTPQPSAFQPNPSGVASRAAARPAQSGAGAAPPLPVESGATRR